MGPVAAVLAGGLDVDAVGSEVSPDSCVCLDLPVACVSEGKVTGQVLQVDHFGNIRTTIRSTTWSIWSTWSLAAGLTTSSGAGE